MTAYAHGAHLRRHNLRIAIPETFADQLAAVNMADVPNLGLDRHIPRKDQAKAARELFKRLGIKGVSFTTPMYSMASSVDVRVPDDDTDPHELDKQPHDYRAETHDPRCAACDRRSARRAKVEAILDAAFPNHRDRSDLQSDYHDSRWSVQ